MRNVAYEPTPMNFDFGHKYDELNTIEIKKRKIEKDIEDAKYMLYSQAYREAANGNMRWIPLIMLDIVRHKLENNIRKEFIVHHIITTVIAEATNKNARAECPIFDILLKFISRDLDPRGVNARIADLFKCKADDPLQMNDACGVYLNTGDMPVLSESQIIRMKQRHGMNPLIYSCVCAYYIMTDNKKEEILAKLKKMRLGSGYSKERMLKKMKDEYPDDESLCIDAVNTVIKLPYICMEWAYDTIEKPRKELKSLLLYIRHRRPESIFYHLPLELFAIVMDFAGLYPPPRFI